MTMKSGGVLELCVCWVGIRDDSPNTDFCREVPFPNSHNRTKIDNLTLFKPAKSFTIGEEIFRKTVKDKEFRAGAIA